MSGPRVTNFGASAFLPPSILKSLGFALDLGSAAAAVAAAIDLELDEPVLAVGLLVDGHNGHSTQRVAVWLCP